jgi:hypothetical protein
MPCTAGTVPVLMLAWPAHVTVVVMRVIGLSNQAPSVIRTMQALGPLVAKLIHVVAAHLIDRDQHHQLGLFGQRRRQARRLRGGRWRSAG